MPPQTAQELQETQPWDRILGEIARNVRPQQFSTWFKPVTALTVSAERLELEVPNPWTQEWLAKNYLKVIRDSAERVLGAVPDVVFRIRPGLPAAAPEAPVAEAAPEPAAVDGELRLNAEYTFDNFVVGQTNRLAHAAATMVADAPAHTFNPLFLYGDVGMGKTHLLQAICHHMRGKRPVLKIRYVSCETFTNDFISSLQTRTVDRFRERYRKVDVLLVDDVHFLAGKSSTQDEFYHTFNALFNEKKQIILSSDGPPEAIPTVEQRLLSRLKWGMVAAIAKPDYETRILVLKKKAQMRGVPFPDTVIQFLATHIDTNVRELDGAVVKLVGHSLLTQRPLTLELAREVFQGSIRSQTRRITLQDVQTLVTEHFQVKLSDLQSKKRNKAVAGPRQVCMFLSRRLTENSLEEIGRYFGGRDHSTVIYACEQIEERAKLDAQFQGMLDALGTRLKRKGN